MYHQAVTGIRTIATLALLLSVGPVAAEVAADAALVRPLLPGHPAPGFTAITASGEAYTLDPANMEKAVVVIFYRGGWCPYCNLYWSELRRIEDELLALGHDYLFVSPDRPQLLAEAVADMEDAPRYLLASDADSSIAEAFGIAFRVDPATLTRYQSAGIDLAAASGFDHLQLPAPAVFIIDTDGIIKFTYVNPDYKVRLHPDVLLAAARTMPDYRLRRGSAR